MSDKLKLLFIPFILSLLGSLIGYTFLHWIFFIKFSFFNIKEIFLVFGIPITLAGLITFFYIRPKLKVLKLKTEKGTWADFYSIICWIIFFVPLMIAQNLLITASGELRKLNSIDEINQTTVAKYYTLKSHYIDKKFTSVYLDVEATGKNNNKLGLYVYASIPIFNKAEDTINHKPSAWLGIKYSESISNRLDPAEKEKKFHEFVDQSEIDFKNKNITQFIYLDRIGNSDEKAGYNQAIKNNRYFKTLSDPSILVGINEPFEVRNGNKLETLTACILIGSVIWLIMILSPKTNQRELKRIKEGKPDKKAQKENREMLELLIPQEGNFITLILIYINIGTFILMFLMGYGFLSFKGQDLLYWGANYGPLVKDGQWWRLISCIFVSGGVMHLLTNMLGLFLVGLFLEPVLGRKYFLLVYLLTGITASITSILWYDHTISVGASGAIFGLYGLFLSFIVFKVFHPEFGKAFLLSTLIFIGFNLIMGLGGGIDNAAHIGGLLSGFIIGAIFRLFMKENPKTNS
ncbi:rhomboid family intramembrane serine protease [Chryseobacterium sp. MIQD13]|uniref:rhomboid family intramembrane serine protease n=1 Tax=Chryseobacterium sp. MIQD13 TaxID=3422310 RepID=UPI003D292799